MQSHPSLISRRYIKIIEKKTSLLSLRNVEFNLKETIKPGQ